MNIIAGFADISVAQLLLVACVALFASVIGGLAGYGTGALMPLVLVPLIGAEPVVPIIAISSVFTNLSRLAAYFRYADRRRALIVLAAASLTTVLGAYGYTRLTNAGAALVIGAMLISSVPLRRVLKRREIRLGDAGLAASAGLGTLLGMRHALEPDHLAAISTLLTGERNARKAAWLGVYWGIGHTMTLLAAGTLLVVLRAEMPAMASDILACAVVLLLVGFGLRAIYLGAGQAAAVPRHSHVHGPTSASASRGQWTLARRPLLVGAVLGLAGSGALTALVMATIPSTGARLIYLMLFGVGSTLGMAALSGLMGWPIARVGAHGAVARSISLAVGCVSIVLGLYWGYPLLGRLLPL